MPVNIPIKRRLLEYEVVLSEDGVAGSYVDGIWQDKKASAPVIKKLAIFEVGTRDLKASPEGMFVMGDIKIYEVGAASIPEKSTLVFGSHTYEIVNISDRNKDGEFSWYIGRKKVKPE